MRPTMAGDGIGICDSSTVGGSKRAYLMTHATILWTLLVRRGGAVTATLT